MPLSESQRAAVISRAKEDGIDENEALKMVESIKSLPEDSPKEIKALEDKPFYQWHTPYILVRELRAKLGLTERIKDDDMICAEFEIKHGARKSYASSIPQSGSVPVEQ